MNDMMPTIEEALTPEIEAQIEYERECGVDEQIEQWDALEAQYGPLMPLLHMVRKD